MKDVSFIIPLTLDEADRGIDVEELLVPLKHVLDILQSDEKGGNHYE